MLILRILSFDSNRTMMVQISAIKPKVSNYSDTNDVGASCHLTGVEFMLGFLFLLTDLLWGPGQVYSLEFSSVLSNFPLDLSQVHLQRKNDVVR